MEPPTAQEEIKLENTYQIKSDKENIFNLTFQNLIQLKLFHHLKRIV